MKTVTILQIPFQAMTKDALMQTLRGYLNGNRTRVVVTPNPEAVMQARRDPAFLEALLSADMRLPDGIGVVIASRLYPSRIPCRLGGCDMTLALFDAIKHEGRTVYLLGAAPGVAEKAAERLTRDYPGLRVIGHHHGYFNEDEERIILDELRRLNPDILIIGTGMPRQEKWAARHRAQLTARLVLCLGGTLNIMAGTLKRPPALMRKLGLEWLGRLLIEPSRAKRMLDLPRFMWAALREPKR